MIRGSIEICGNFLISSDSNHIWYNIFQCMVEVVVAHCHLNFKLFGVENSELKIKKKIKLLLWNYF